MLKRSFVLFLIIFTCFSSVSYAYANDYHEQKIYYEAEMKRIKEEIKNATDDQLPELNKQYNNAASHVTAYEKAIEYDSENRVISGNNYTFSSVDYPPGEFLSIYKDAGKKYGVDWSILAAIHKIETQFSTIDNMISSAGAIGHMQFMPSTWDYYGVDVRGKGKADPWDIEDAIHSAANYLSASGASSGQIRQAVFAYNRSDRYVNDVLNLANTYSQSYSNNGYSHVVDVGKRFIGRSTYVFGGGRTQRDIDKAYFDCSSFVHWAYNEIGINLGNRTSVTTDTLKLKGKRVSFNDIRVGDLVFFDTYKKDGHVGIYAGNNTFIGAQESTGVAIADMSNPYWKKTFKGHVVRIE